MTADTNEVMCSMQQSGICAEPCFHAGLQGSSACRHTKCDAAAAQGTAPAASAPAPQQAAPTPLSRAEHNETQTKCFCDQAAVQRSMRIPDKELEKASSVDPASSHESMVQYPDAVT
jgi:hypothetical protein